MTEQRFDLVFRGDIVIGHDLVEVKSRLQQLFKADTARIDALFSGRPVPLKRNLDEATAVKYKAVLAKAGAEVAMAPAASDKPSAPAASRGLSLAPVGSPLLRPRERNEPPPPVAVDISALSLKPAEGNLLEVSERQATAVAQVTVPDFDLAEVGAVLADPSARPALPEVDFADNHWDLSAPGEDLLKPEERRSEQPQTVTDLAVDLAPVGSDLGQIKEKKPALNPDTSALRLED